MITPLTPAIVAEARAQAAKGVPIQDLASKFRVSYAALHSAIRGRTWRHLDVPPVPGASRASDSYRARRILTEDQVATARRRVAAGESYSDVSMDLGVGRQAVYAAVTGSTWSEMTTPPPVVRVARR